MNYVQIVSPNLNTLGQIGWCLSFVEDVFNTPHSYATATDAWNAVRTPHLDRALPEVSVPVWYSYFEGGINYGHVAVWVPSRGVLSSPYKQNGTSQWFDSIDQCGAVLRSTYLGWSEDLAGVQIVKQGEEMLSKPEVIQVYKLAFDDEDKDVPQNVIDAFTGKPTAELVNYLIQDASYQAHKARVNSAPQATKLAPGLYQV